MDEITMFASLRPEAPDDADLNEMSAGARRRFAAAKPGARARLRRPVLAGRTLAAAGLTAVAAGGATAVVLASGGTAAPAAHLSNVVTAAWTVRENADGTVMIDIRQLADPAKLQQVLRDDGINAFVRPLHWGVENLGPRKFYLSPSCTYAQTNHAPQSVQQAVVTAGSPRGWLVRPSAMPAGTALFVSGTALSEQGHVAAVVGSEPVMLNNDKLPACVPYSRGNELARSRTCSMRRTRASWVDPSGITLSVVTPVSR